MRKAAGTLCVLAGLALAYGFAVYAAPSGAQDAWGPFAALGRRFPGDVALLLGAAWLAGSGLAMLLHEPVGPGGRFDASGRFVASTNAFRASSVFVVHSLLFLSLLFAAAVGVFARHKGPAVALLTATAAIQAATGLILMIMSFFDRPRASGRLTVGTAAYMVSTVAAVAVLVLGKPD